MLCYHLVRRLVVLLEHLQQVAGDSPGYSRDAEMWGCMHHAHTLQGKAGENGQPGCCLCKSGIQETVGYAGGNCQLGSLTTGSPAGHLLPYNADSRVSTACSSLVPSGDLFSEDLIARTEWWLNVQSGLQDPGNNTLELLQSA